MAKNSADVLDEIVTAMDAFNRGEMDACDTLEQIALAFDGSEWTLEIERAIALGA